MLVPFFAGIFAIGKPGIPTLLLFVCVVSLYLLRGCAEFYLVYRSKQKELYQNINLFYRYSFSIVLKFLITALLLLFYFQLWNLLILGIIALSLFGLYYFLESSKQSSRIFQELIVILGLTLTAPAAYYVTVGKWDKNVILLWSLNIIFFQLGLLYVHTKIVLHKKRKQIICLRDKLFYCRNLMGGWGFAVIILYVLFLTGFIRPAFFVVLLPVAIHMIIGIFFHKKELKIKRMGYAQVGQDILFLIILVYLFRT